MNLVKDNMGTEYRERFIYKLGIADCLYANEDVLKFVKTPLFRPRSHPPIFCIDFQPILAAPPARLHAPPRAPRQAPPLLQHPLRRENVRGRQRFKKLPKTDEVGLHLLPVHGHRRAPGGHHPLQRPRIRGQSGALGILRATGEDGGRGQFQEQQI